MDSVSRDKAPLEQGRLYRLFVAFMVLVLMLGQVLIWSPPENSRLHDRLEGFVYDLLLPVTESSSDTRIVMVDIDERSLSEYGRWPWSRGELARLLAGIQQSNPAAIGLDILFPEPSSGEGDRLLSEQLQKDNVTAAVAFGETALPATEREGGNGWPQSLQKVAVADSLRVNEAEIGKVGHITPIYSRDNVIRHLYPIICQDGLCYSALSIAMLENWSGLQVATNTVGRTVQRESLCVASFCLSVNKDKTVLIPYQHRRQFNVVSASEVLQHQGVAQKALDGAFVLVGTSAIGLGDRVSTPLHADVPGVELHAVLLAAALDNVVWSKFPWSQQLSALLVLIVFVVSIYWPLCARRGKAVVLAVMVVAASATLVVSLWSFWLQPLVIWVTTITSFMTLIVWDVAHAQVYRSRMYAAFSAYVPPVVIKSLLKSRVSASDLVAKRAEVTVLFADIQGFTSLSEKLEPEALVELTNHLFTEITREIYAHYGTLDKYMGDAVMAFWGAPLKQEDHAQLAVNCAVAIQQRLDELSGWLAEKGFPEVIMNIGLESGVVTVGDLGSRQRRAYTVMGKAANVASHLQKQCERTGQKVLCGPVLCGALPSERLDLLSELEIRGLDGLQVVGRPASP